MHFPEGNLVRCTLYIHDATIDLPWYEYLTLYLLPVQFKASKLSAAVCCCLQTETHANTREFRLKTRASVSALSTPRQVLALCLRQRNTSPEQHPSVGPTRWPWLYPIRGGKGWGTAAGLQPSAGATGERTRGSRKEAAATTFGGEEGSRTSADN